MYRLAVFKILSAKNVIDEILTANVIAINTAKIIEVYDAPAGAAIKIKTSPKHDGYIYVAETRQQILSFLGGTITTDITLTKANRQEVTIALENIYWAYPKKERVIVSYYDGKITSVTLKMTFEEFIRKFNSI